MKFNLRARLTAELRGNILGSADWADLARQILVARLHEALRQSTPTATATDTNSELQLLEVLQSAQEERQRSSPTEASR